MNFGELIAKARAIVTPGNTLQSLRDMNTAQRAEAQSLVSQDGNVARLKRRAIAAAAGNALNSPAWAMGTDAAVGVAYVVGTIGSGNPVLTMPNTAGIVAGMSVEGTGIPAGATVQSVTPNTSVTLSANPTATNSNVRVRFLTGGLSTTYRAIHYQGSAPNDGKWAGPVTTIPTTAIAIAKSAPLVAGAQSIALAGTSNIALGQRVEGLGVPDGATVTGINPGSSVSISAPLTIDTGGTTVALTFWFPEKSPISIFGGWPYFYGNSQNNLQVASCYVGAAGTSTIGTAPAVEFMTDGPAVMVQCYPNGANQQIRSTLNKKYLGLKTPAFGSFPDTNSSWYAVEGMSGTTRVRIETSGAPLWQNIYVPAPYSIWPVSAADGTDTVAYFGDSYAASGATSSFPHDNLASLFGQLAGCNVVPVAIGGTGWTSNGGTNNTFGSSPRLATLARVRNRRGIISFGSINDNGANAAEVTAAVDAWLVAVRGVDADSPIGVFGVPACTNVQLTETTRLENAIAAGVAAYIARTGDSKVRFFPVSTDPAGAWLTSTNYTPTTGYGAADGSHLQSAQAPIGTVYVAGKMVKAWNDWIASL